MPFDVRFPIGLLFLALGALVGLEGLIGDQAAIAAVSPGVNIDLAWGGVMSAFGAVMTLMAALARRAGRSKPE